MHLYCTVLGGFWQGFYGFRSKGHLALYDTHVAKSESSAPVSSKKFPTRMSKTLEALFTSLAALLRLLEEVKNEGRKNSQAQYSK